MTFGVRPAVWRLFSIRATLTLPLLRLSAIRTHTGGGTMHNKVVYHAMKAFSSFGLPVLRFNFRSVGLSEGDPR